MSSRFCALALAALCSVIIVRAPAAAEEHDRNEGCALRVARRPLRHALKQELGQAFIDWLISGEGQAAIASYRINGQQLFFPDAGNGPS